MNQPFSRLHQQAREQAEAHTHSVQPPAAKEFATPEELLRFDAAQTEVPPGVAQRLRESVQREPKPERPWWRRMFEG